MFVSSFLVYRNEFLVSKLISNNEDEAEEDLGSHAHNANFVLHDCDTDYMISFEEQNNAVEEAKLMEEIREGSKRENDVSKKLCDGCQYWERMEVNVSMC
jgi:hypothetical protein